MKKILFLLAIIPLLLCCQGSGTNTTDGNNQAHNSGSGPGSLSDSQRVATLEQEVQMLIAQYDIDHNPQLIAQAMQLNDSIQKIDTTQQGQFNAAFTRAQLLAKSGHMREAMAIQEQLLNNSSDEFVRLQFYAGKYRMEGKLDSMHICANEAISKCDKIIADSTQAPEAIDQALMNKMYIYQIVDNRAKAKEANDQLAGRHKDDPEYQISEAQFNEEFNAARAALNQSAEEYRNSPKK
ncbi:MAG: hypothetical protein ACI30R_07605 [Sodaliphilus sp.]